MKSDIAEAVFRQLEARGPLKPREIKTVVANYSNADVSDDSAAEQGVAVAIAARLGRRVEWTTQNGTLFLAARAEMELTRAVAGGPAKWSTLSRAARVWWRQHNKRLPIVSSPNKTLRARTVAATHAPTGPYELTDAAVADIAQGEAFALGHNWAVRYKEPVALAALTSERPQLRRAWSAAARAHFKK